MLLLAGASPHYVGGLMQNAPLLALFAHEGYEEMVALLLEFGSDVNCRNADGITPLMFACQKGNPEVARTLVQHHQVKILNREVDSNRTCQSTKESSSTHLFVVQTTPLFKISRVINSRERQLPKIRIASRTIY